MVYNYIDESKNHVDNLTKENFKLRKEISTFKIKEEDLEKEISTFKIKEEDLEKEISNLKKSEEDLRKEYD